MKQRSIVHFCRPNTAAGSRVYSQCTLIPNSEVVIGKWNTLPYRKLLKRFRSGEPHSLVFHQQLMLIPLLLLFFTSKLFGHKNIRFVYDMHDLIEINEWHNLQKRVEGYLFYFLELIVARLPITVMTVSKGLKQEFLNRYHGKALVVYNLPTLDNTIVVRKPLEKKEANDRIRVVYFGHLKPSRLHTNILKKLAELGIAVDLYGYFTDDTCKEWVAKILRITHSSGGQYLGRYHPGDLSFLDNYTHSLMAFPSSAINIRYCMPNKLFQSLQHGLTCIVSDNMTEIMSEFQSTGAVLEIDDFVSRLESYSTPEATERLQSMLEKSKKNYLTAIDSAT